MTRMDDDAKYQRLKQIRVDTDKPSSESHEAWVWVKIQELSRNGQQGAMAEVQASRDEHRQYNEMRDAQIRTEVCEANNRANTVAAAAAADPNFAAYKILEDQRRAAIGTHTLAIKHQTDALNTLKRSVDAL